MIPDKSVIKSISLKSAKIGKSSLSNSTTLKLKIRQNQMMFKQAIQIYSEAIIQIHANIP